LDISDLLCGGEIFEARDRTSDWATEIGQAIGRQILIAKKRETFVVVVVVVIMSFVFLTAHLLDNPHTQHTTTHIRQQ